MKAAFFVTAFVSLVGPIAVAQTQTPQPTLKQHAPSEPPAMAPAPTTQDIKGSVKLPTVSIVEPKDGATVSKTFTVKFAVEGMKVANSGDMTAGTGHHHLIVDGGPIKKGEVVPTDNTHLHFGTGQAETSLTLPKGEHTLTVQFADGAHVSYGEMMSQTIKVRVK